MEKQEEMRTKGDRIWGDRREREVGKERPLWWEVHKKVFNWNSPDGVREREETVETERKREEKKKSRRKRYRERARREDNGM